MQGKPWAYLGAQIFEKTRIEATPSSTIGAYTSTPVTSMLSTEYRNLTTYQMTKTYYDLESRPLA